MKTNRSHNSISIGFLIIAVSLSGLGLHAQTRRSRPVERVTYYEVRDYLFREFFVGRGSTGYGVGIRYIPCNGRELQFIIMETYYGQTEARLITPVKDSLREQFKAYMKRHPNARFEQVMPAMKVNKQVLAFSTAEIRSLRQEILDTMERSIRSEKEIWPNPGGRWTTTFHSECVGDSYQMWFEGVSDLALSSGMNDDAPEAPFITWMKEKRPLFEKWAESKLSN